jgi:hypothetical protein
MGTFHMALLLLFDTSDQLSYKELQENTKLTEEQLHRHLQSLVDARILLVFENSSSCSVSSLTSTSNQSTSISAPCGSPSQTSQHSPDTYYTLNKHYFNKRLKFKITAVQQKEVQQVRKLDLNYESENLF